MTAVITCRNPVDEADFDGRLPEACCFSNSRTSCAVWEA